MAWNDEMDKLLGRCIIERKTSSEAMRVINLQFPGSVPSRNAVIGRIARRGRTYLMALARDADPELLSKYREEAPVKLNRKDPTRAERARRHEVGESTLVGKAARKRVGPPQWARPKSDSTEENKSEAMARAMRAERRVSTAKAEESKPTTFLNLRFDQCKWPLGDVGTPEFRFCGAAREKAGKPYCEFHRKMASGGFVRRVTESEHSLLMQGKRKESGLMLRARG